MCNISFDLQYKKSYDSSIYKMEYIEEMWKYYAGAQDDHQVEANNRMRRDEEGTLELNMSAGTHSTCFLYVYQ